MRAVLAVDALNRVSEALMLGRPHKLAKNERNQALFRDYLGGMLQSELAAKYGLSRDRVGFLLYRHGIRLCPAERARRYRIPAKRQNGGRKPAWPDCPPELSDDYRLLRRYMPAAEARAALERTENGTGEIGPASRWPTRADLIDGLPTFAARSAC